MPEFDLPGGPVRLRIRNGSGSKTIKKVEVGVKPTGGAYNEVEVQNMPPIPPVTGVMQAENDSASGSTDSVCVTVFWDNDSAQCCCDFQPALANGIDKVVARFVDPDTISMTVFPLPRGTDEFTCACREDAK